DIGILNQDAVALSKDQESDKQAHIGHRPFVVAVKVAQQTEVGSENFHKGKFWDYPDQTSAES
ncbi:MAG: hypothetical protein II631_02230, partial [Treponema sp.]|nr:hypothetical protein [Treponema sp.]